MNGTSVLRYQVRPTPLGLIVLEHRDPEVVLLGLRFSAGTGGLLVPEDDSPGILETFLWGASITVDETEAAETDEPLHMTKACEARYEPQPDWWNNSYMSVTGLRFRCCANLFEDGEHAPWCPA